MGKSVPPECPPIDQKLIDFLSYKYPDRCPDPEDTPREIWMAVGAAQVVTHLKARLEKQSKNLSVT